MENLWVCNWSFYVPTAYYLQVNFTATQGQLLVIFSMSSLPGLRGLRMSITRVDRS